MKINKTTYLEHTPGIYDYSELSKHKLTVAQEVRFKKDQKGAHHFDILTAQRKDETPQRWRRLTKAEIDLLIELSPEPFRLWVEAMREKAKTAAQVD